MPMKASSPSRRSASPARVFRALGIGFGLLLVTAVLAAVTLKSGIASAGNDLKPATAEQIAAAEAKAAKIAARPTKQSATRARQAEQAAAGAADALIEGRIADLGINLSPYTDYCEAWAFTDVMTRARPWMIFRDGADQWGTEGEHPTDDMGWAVPTANLKPFTIMFIESQGAYPGGRYTLTYEGRGTIHMGWDAQLDRRLGANAFAVNVRPNTGIYLRIEESDPNDPVRNIKLFMPGYGPSEPKAGQAFHDLFLERLRPFQTVRYMNWQRINNNPSETWADRTTPAHATQNLTEGVALEHIFTLANTLQSDAWICVPHRVNDDYIRRMAELARDQLDPTLKLYIEHSNEVWNGQFQQANYAREAGRAANLHSDPFRAQLFHHAKRSIEVFRIFTAVFGDQAESRLVCCMGSQSGNPWVSEQLLGYPGAAAVTDALAIAPYFGLDVAKQVQDHANCDTRQVLRYAAEDLLNTSAERIAAHKAHANRHGVALVAYESGQHLVGHSGVQNDERVTNLLIDANRQPEIGQMTQRLRDLWREAGGSTYVSYAFVRRPSKWGSWGHLETMDQPLEEAHKYRMLIAP